MLHLALAALLPGLIRIFYLVAILIEPNGSSSSRRYTLLDFEVTQVLYAVLWHDFRGIQAIFIEVIPTVTPGVGRPTAISVIIFEVRL